MGHQDVQRSLLQALLEAPGSTEGWELFLRQLCDAFHGSSAKFIVHSLASGDAITANVSVMVRTDPRAIEEYQQHWYQHDPWRNAMSPDVQAGLVLVGDQLISPDRIRRTAFYNDFGHPYDTTQCLAGILEISPRLISNISVNRDDRSPRFDTADVDLLDALMPSLRRAIELHRRLSGAELMAAHALEMLARLSHGVILMSATGAVIWTNRAADVVLRARDGLTLERGELRGATPSVTARFRVALSGAIAMSKGQTLDAGETVLSLPRASGRRALSVLITPLSAIHAALIPDEAAAAVFVDDPELIKTPDADAIRALFGLTRAESELVHCLVAGLSLEAASARLGLRSQTVRTRLKVVFQKTNTHRQAELVRLVLTSAAALA
ncbi:MAG: hypothetical protein HOP16_18000 [Acidobacteria bacterium]|nr:hypothetical protein [Acidobacteriota bacterium]